MKLIDTDILIDHFHGNAAATALMRDWLLAGETVCISVVTVTEILAGMRDGEQADTDELLALFFIQDMDETLARVAGGYLNQFARSHRLDLGDAVIAATAKILGASLYTRNVRHYPMTDIDVIAPYQRGA